MNTPLKRIIKLDRINLEASPMVRSELNHEAIVDYTQGYLLKESIPEIVLFQMGECPLMCADGRHRIAAMLKAGIKERTCLIYTGGYEACLKFALQANLFHGLRRTNADKRVGVTLALQTFPKMSNNVIAEIAAVGDDLVAGMRKEMQGNGTIPKVETVTGKGGRKHPVQKQDRYRKTIPSEGQNHQNIGKSAEVQKDDTGYPLTTAVMPLWNRRREVKELLGYLDAVKRAVSKALDDDDRLFTAEMRNTFLTDISNVITQLKSALPHAVCPYCQGKLMEKCAFCGQRGVISEHKLKVVPPELMKVRNLAVKSKYENSRVEN